MLHPEVSVGTCLFAGLFVGPGPAQYAQILEADQVVLVPLKVAGGFTYVSRFANIFPQ